MAEKKAAPTPEALVRELSTFPLLGAMFRAACAPLRVGDENSDGPLAYEIAARTGRAQRYGADAASHVRRGNKRMEHRDGAYVGWRGGHRMQLPDAAAGAGLIRAAPESTLPS